MTNEPTRPGGEPRPGYCSRCGAMMVEGHEAASPCPGSEEGHAWQPLDEASEVDRPRPAV